MARINQDIFDDVLPGGDPKIFSYKIKYNNPENQSRILGKFTGNISEIDWVYETGSAIKKRYNYNYDPLNMLNSQYLKSASMSFIYQFNNEK